MTWSLFHSRKADSAPSHPHPQFVDVRKLRSALPAILGKTIAHVVIASRPGEPSQLFLVFTDDTHYELYGIGSMSGGRGISQGGLDVVRRATADTEMVIEVCSLEDEEQVPRSR